MHQRLKIDDLEAIYECIEFTLAESFGVWHNRARAKICRNLAGRLRDVRLKDRLVRVIANRLITGQFGQQFKDQLRMAVRFEPERLRKAAVQVKDDNRQYVRRYAQWTLNFVDSYGRANS